MAAAAKKRHGSQIGQESDNSTSMPEVNTQTTKDNMMHDEQLEHESDVSDGEGETFHESKEETHFASLSPLPDLDKLSTNELLLVMYGDLREMKTDVSAMKTNTEYALKELVTCKKDVKELKTTTANLSAELQISKNEIVTLRSQNEALTKRMVQLDSYSRRNNLIFYGVKRKPDEDCFEVIKTLFCKQLNIVNANDFKLERCHRLRSQSDPQPIIVRFNWYQDRVTVWNNRKMLKDTGISMREDFPSEIVESRKTLFPILKKARDLKKEAFLVADKLTIDGTVYTMTNLHTLPPNLNPASVATKTIGNITAFYSKSSPLSNFYEADVQIDNEVFSSVEQYFQYQKAVYAEKPDVARKIKSTKSPALCKKFGDAITLDNDPEWWPVAKKTLSKACMEKFQQNVRAKSFLLNTGKTILAEATRDDYWGIGLPLSSKTISDQTSWTGANQFGHILMKVRGKLSN